MALLGGIILGMGGGCGCGVLWVVAAAVRGSLGRSWCGKRVGWSTILQQLLSGAHLGRWPVYDVLV